MVFQPIVDLKGRELVGAEALARFSGPPQRAPSHWFAEATTVGLRTELELHAVELALAAMPLLPATAFMTINASPSTLLQARLPKLVAVAGGERVVIEITEHAPISDYRRLLAALERLRGLGVRLAIDDAGAGYSSLRHILELHPDFIKLDISLIRNIHRDGSKQALAAGLISFAEKSGAAVIAEGVEVAAEAATLTELGVGHGQGYLLGRPASLPF
jgi:EAL domain-containing protein (putative c-di-GMP-specific phosphodiesterase class I)